MPARATLSDEDEPHRGGRPRQSAFQMRVSPRIRGHRRYRDPAVIICMAKKANGVHGDSLSKLFRVRPAICRPAAFTLHIGVGQQRQHLLALPVSDVGGFPCSRLRRYTSGMAVCRPARRCDAARLHVAAGALRPAPSLGRTPTAITSTSKWTRRAALHDAPCPVRTARPLSASSRNVTPCASRCCCTRMRTLPDPEYCGRTRAPARSHYGHGSLTRSRMPFSAFAGRSAPPPRSARADSGVSSPLQPAARRPGQSGIRCDSVQLSSPGIGGTNGCEPVGHAAACHRRHAAVDPA